MNKGFFIAACLLFSALTQQVHAQIYRCTDADGSTTFSQTPCAADQASQTYKQVKIKPVDADACREAHDFAQHVFNLTYRQQDATGAFAALGGVNSLRPPIINIVNYVASFRFNENVSAMRIASLVQVKCQNRAFDDIKVSDFPQWRPEQPAYAENPDIQTGMPAQASQETPLPTGPTAEQCKKLAAQLESYQNMDTMVTGEDFSKQIQSARSYYQQYCSK